MTDARSSWLLPTAVGALATIVLTVLAGLLATPAGAAVPCACCCALPLGAPLLGFVPVAIALHRDPSFTPGQGFALAFTAVGLGATVLAVAATVHVRGIDAADIHAAIDDAVRQMPPERRAELPPERIAEWKDGAVELLPYAPAIAATLLSLGAGIAGLLFTAVLRRRHTPPANGEFTV